MASDAIKNWLSHGGADHQPRLDLVVHPERLRCVKGQQRKHRHQEYGLMVAIGEQADRLSIIRDAVKMQRTFGIAHNLKDSDQPADGSDHKQRPGDVANGVEFSGVDAKTRIKAPKQG